MRDCLQRLLSAVGGRTLEHSLPAPPAQHQGGRALPRCIAGQAAVLNRCSVSKGKQSLAALKKGKWYYRVETAPGFFTDGRHHENLGIVRALLRDVDFQGLCCLDVGIQEGVIPCLMKQAGAGDVTATDWIDETDQIKKVESAYNVNF